MRFSSNKVLLLGAAFLVLGIGALPLFAQPDLKSQKTWGKKEKAEFMEFLRFGKQPDVRGQVKGVELSTAASRAAARRAYFITANLNADALLSLSEGGYRWVSSGFGGRLLVGGHLFSWVRYYGGFAYNRMFQKRLDGTKVGLDHFQIPLGVELALIPLGTPHTRYLVLRGGLSLHQFRTPEERANLQTPMTGWHGAWNAGLGYEWQFPDSRWRFHLVLEGYRAFSSRFYGLGVTTGFVLTL